MTVVKSHTKISLKYKSISVLMMDYYGNFPPPPKEVAIQEVINKVGEEKIVRRIMSDLDLGSCTGWYVSVKPDTIKRVKAIVQEREREKRRVEYVMRHILGDDTFTY